MKKWYFKYTSRSNRKKGVSSTEYGPYESEGEAQAEIALLDYALRSEDIADYSFEPPYEREVEP